MKTILVIFLLSFALTSNAATINASSNARDDVQTAVLSTSDGDTVVIPDGSVNWTNGVWITNKALTITAQTQGGLTITNNHLNGSSGAMFSFQRCTNKFFRVTGINFQEHNTVNGAYDIAIGAHGSQTDQNVNWRIDRCTWPRRYAVARGIYVSGKAYGLIDQCKFFAPTNTDTALQDIAVLGDNFGTAPSQTSGTSWTLAPSMGTTNCVVIEDCVFGAAHVQDAAVEGYAGGRIAIRHCIITNNFFGAHGNDSGTRSTYQYEIYNNDYYFTNAGSAPTSLFDTRGGASILASNTMTALYNGSTATNINLLSYRSTYTNVFASFPSGFLGITNILDGCSNSTGWPGLDQVGRVGPTVFNSTNVSQPSVPAYQWSNTVSGPDFGPHNAAFAVGLYYNDASWPAGLKNATNHIQSGRDYFDNEIPSTSVWQPLTYPHPLRTAMDSIGGSSVPAIVSPGKTRRK